MRRRSIKSSIRYQLAIGTLLAAMVGFGVGGWAVATELAGAVIASGVLVVDSSVKKVQHPTGGIVGELRVRDGDRVKAGDILVRLDETQTRAMVAVVSKGLDELAARQARLQAERDDADAIAFPPDLLARPDDPELARVVAGERKLFELRRTARTGQKAQLRERIGQLKEEVQGLEAQVGGKRKEIDLIQIELKGVRELWDKHMVQISRLTSLERDAARLEGERGQLLGAIAQSKGKMTETELQIIQVDQDLRSEVGKELAEIRGKTSELVERKVAAEDQLKRVDIRAPQDGTVHQLTVHTVGGVIGPGEPLMLVVPDHDVLTVEAKIATQDISQLHLGQEAILRFPAFNQRTTPEIFGKVTIVSPDITQDQRTGASFYTVRIALGDGEAAKLGEKKLVPGMPVEAFIQTEARTALSYLVKPLQDQVARAFKER
jgi:HlyD family secretion protein